MAQSTQTSFSAQRMDKSFSSTKNASQLPRLYSVECSRSYNLLLQKLGQDMSEAGEVVDVFLRWLYPVSRPVIKDPELLEALTSIVKKYEVWDVLDTLDWWYAAKEVWKVPVPVTTSRPKCVFKAEEQTQLKEGIEEEIEKEISHMCPACPIRLCHGLRREPSWVVASCSRSILAGLQMIVCSWPGEKSMQGS